MNHILNYLKTHFISLCISFLLLLIVWLRGPELVLFGVAPLQSTEQRIFIISLVLIGWFIKIIFIDTRPKSKKPSLSADAQKKLQHLQGKFHGAIAFLKKTVINKQEKNVNLLRLPWYLLIGPTGSGKSTLLANANINYILAKQFKSANPKMIISSESCDWWVTRDLVLVDIPGNYLISKTTNASPQQILYPLLWKKLIELISKYRRKKYVPQGVVIALNLPEIVKLHKQQKNQIVQDIKKRLFELFETFGDQLPIQLVITKCDLLPGFIEFFGECSVDEASQAWGITMPHLNENENLIDVFTQRFNALIKRLNKQLIPRLHQERNPNIRPYIKDFPLHVERLKEGIVQFLKTLSLPKSTLQGVYLTSGSQNEPEEASTYLSSTLANFNNQALQIMAAPPMPPRSYFARQLILHNLLITSQPSSNQSRAKNGWQRRIVYAASIGTIITAGVFLGRDFQHGVEQAYSIQNELAQYQARVQQASQKGEHLTEALPLLNALEQAAKHAKDKLSLEFYSNKSQQTAKTVYQTALQTLVIPQIKLYFESYLQNTPSNNPEYIYKALEAYLMLGDKEYFQADFVAKMLQQLMPANANQEAIKELSKHVHAALNAKQLSVHLNQEIIANARKELLSLNNSDLGFMLLKSRDNNNVDSEVKLDTEKTSFPVFTSHIVATQIPTMYTEKAFKKITYNEIPMVAREVMVGNWVLGYNPTPPDELAINEFAAQLNTEYIAKYVDIWESLLANIQLRSPKNLVDINEMITALTGNNSPLLLLLNTIKQNTSYPPILSASPKLQNLSVLLDSANNNQPGGLYGIFIGLKELQNYLQPIVNAPDRDKAILVATAKRMQDPNNNDALRQVKSIADQSPEPMKTWLNTIAIQTWHFMVQDTGQYMESAWQKDIMATYRSAIMNRYPFEPEAHQEVDLPSFTRFFGQTGQLTNFYHTYLKPFISETQKVKSWRFLDNEKIPLSDTLLSKFEHAYRIQRAFFPNGDNTLYVPFTLQPVSLDKTMKGFTLNINGQQVRFQKNMSRLLTWPGNNSVKLTTMNFVTPSDHLLSDSIPGNWGWFRLVKSATDSIRSNKELVLTFDVDGHKAKYVLFTQSQLNPFVPLNLTKFDLPEHLM